MNSDGGAASGTVRVSRWMAARERGCLAKQDSNHRSPYERLTNVHCSDNRRLAGDCRTFFFAGRNREEKKLTPLAGLAFGFILSGMFFSDNRLVGYGLMGIGVLLAVVDILRNRSKTI